jgi:hypothetical protein
MIEESLWDVSLKPFIVLLKTIKDSREISECTLCEPCTEPRHVYPHLPVITVLYSYVYRARTRCECARHLTSAHLYRALMHCRPLGYTWMVEGCRLLACHTDNTTECTHHRTEHRTSFMQTQQSVRHLPPLTSCSVEICLRRRRWSQRR